MARFEKTIKTALSYPYFRRTLSFTRDYSLDLMFEHSCDYDLIRNVKVYTKIIKLKNEHNSWCNTFCANGILVFV